MIESLRAIGVFSLKEKGKSEKDILSILVENPANKYYQKVVALDFKETSEGLRFSGLYFEDMDLDFEKYLYKKKGANGANYTPAALVAGKGINGTFRIKIVAWARGAVGEKGDVGELARAIQSQEEEIEVTLEEKDRELGLSNTLLTVRLNGKYPGQLEAFRDYFVRNYYQAKGAIAIQNGVCSICGYHGFVMGNEKPWTFYSLDKPGFIAGGFNATTGWRNFPICKTCSLLVEEGKQYVEKNLGYRFSGIPYFLLPKSIFNSEKTLKETLTYLHFENRSQIKDVRDVHQLADDEDEILEFASKQSDAINYNFLFYESAKAKFSILLYLQDVLPSTIRRLFNAKSEVDRHAVFKEVYKEEDTLKNVVFTFFNLRRFIHTRKTFLNLVEKIFKQRPIDYFYLLEQILARLRFEFANSHFTRPDTLRAWQIFLFLQELGILNHYEKGEPPMTSQVIENDVKRKVEAFFSQFEDTFNSNAKRAVFLTGVLTSFLLQIQYHDRGSEPFRKNLKGLKMHQRDVLRIFPGVQNKLEEYDKNYYSQLEQVISEYFVRAGSDWQISDDEINFYFLLGMDLSDAKAEDGQPVFKAVKEMAQDE